MKLVKPWILMVEKAELHKMDYRRKAWEKRDVHLDVQLGGTNHRHQEYIASQNPDTWSRWTHYWWVMRTGCLHYTGYAVVMRCITKILL